MNLDGFHKNFEFKIICFIYKNNRGWQVGGSLKQVVLENWDHLQSCRIFTDLHVKNPLNIHNILGCSPSQ